jgi:tetratricopeptide (TPR) repeat protein
LSERLAELQKIAGRSKKPLAWYGLAMEYRGQGDYQRAVETFTRVHEIDANYVPAYFMCAQVYAEHLSRTDLARAELLTGIERARAVGDTHALSEMQGMLDSL